MSAAEAQGWGGTPLAGSPAVLVHPTDWETEVVPELRAVVAVEPRLGERFRANLSLAATPDAGELAAFTDTMLVTLQDELADVRIIDVEPAHVAGLEGMRVLTSYRGPGHPLTLEQWWTVLDGVGLTLSATCDSFDYPALADLFAEAATRMELAGG